MPLELRSKNGRKVYWFRVQVAGKQYRRSTGQGDAEVAKKMEAKFRTELVEGKVFRGGKVPTVESALRERLKKAEHGDKRTQQQIDPVGAETFRQYQRAADSLIKFLGSVRVDKIDSGKIGDYLEHRRTTGRQGEKKDTILANEFQLLRSALRDCRRKHGVPSEDVIALFARPGKRGRRLFIPRAEHMATYLSEAPAPLPDLAVLMLSSGLRPNEALALRASDIRKTSSGVEIRLRRAKHRKDEATIEPVYVSGLEALAVIRRRSQGPAFWPELEKENIDRTVQAVAKMHRAFCDAKGLPRAFVPYSFRHAFISYVVRQYGLAEGQSLARHRDPATTSIYVHATRDPREIVAGFDPTPLLGPAPA
jgi:integrase